MNVVIFLIFAISWFIFAYIWYGKVIQKRLIGVYPENVTPANSINDKKDYVPTKPSILFGHHFSSIAGAGPIVGPILAFSMYGWLPAMIWILVGSVFIGAVHDYCALMISARNKGVSIVQISGDIISHKSRLFFGIFVLITLVLIEAVFADLTARTLAEKPEIVIPTVGIIIIALLFGIAVYRMKMNVVISTVISLVLLTLLIVIGDSTPIKMSYEFWLGFTFLYCFIAATIPVWILLQPRDYLSMYLLIIGLVIGIVALFVRHPEIQAPAYIPPSSGTMPLFPMLFIMVACGAISGFHSLVASGTTAKQLRYEKDGKFIAFGGMITEGIIAIMVLMLISSVLVWAPTAPEFCKDFIFQDLLDQSANIVFGTAFGVATESLGVPLYIGIAFGVLMLNAFILTSLDTSVRLGRYIVQETLGVKYGGILKNKYFATIITLSLSYLLCITNGYKVIWPLFGTSNQLIATIALFLITAYAMGRNKPKWYTLIPAGFMLIVTQVALFYQVIWEYLPKQNYFLSIVAALLFLLEFMLTYDIYKKIRQKYVYGNKKSIKNTTVIANNTH